MLDRLYDLLNDRCRKILIGVYFRDNMLLLNLMYSLKCSNILIYQY